MDQDKYIVIVYNTCTESFEIVKATKSVFNTYMRSKWNIDKNNKKHFAHETAMSSLRGGEDGSFENFKEFIDFDNTPEIYLEEKLALEEVRKAINNLIYEEQELIRAIFFEEKSFREYAKEKEISKSTLHKRKNAILIKLRKILES